MIGRLELFVTVSVCALVAVQASAQEAPAAGPVAATAAASDEIVVTGIRASVQAAQQIKRRATSVVEAITLQDLGKFTDPSITDALQRVPGLNVERNVRGAEGGDGVTIRGLGPSFLSTTLNGRELLGIPAFGGAGGRQFDFGSVPPEILAGVTVYKTSSADLIEPGLAGQVDIETLRPLDYHTPHGGRYFGTFSAAGSYEPNSGTISPRIGGVVGAKLLDGTLGVYLAALYSRDKSRKAEFLTYSGVITNSFNVPDAAGGSKSYDHVFAVNGLDSTISDTTLEKKSIATGLQWKPTSNFEVRGDFTYNKFTTTKRLRGDYFQSNINQLSTATIIQPGAVVVRDGAIVAFDTSRISGLSPSFSNPYAQRQINTNEFYYGGLNAAWHSDNDATRLSVDYSHGHVDYFFDWKRPNISNQAPGGNNISFDGRGATPIIGFSGPAASDIGNPASYTQGDNTYFEVVQQQQLSTRDAVQVDGRQRLSPALVARIGARYARTAGTFVYTAVTPPLDITNIFAGTVTPPFFPGAIPNVSFDNACKANPVDCNSTSQGKGSFTGSFPTSGDGKPGDVFGFAPSTSYDLVETNTAAYGQLELDTRAWGAGLRGNLGLRAVRITEKARGFQGQETKIGFASSGPISSSTVLVEDRTEYWNYLPSLNATLSPRDNINLRFGVAKTISLPNFNSIIPSGVATTILPIGGHIEPNYANVGNTQLRPTKAWNYDLTGEFYTRYDGSVIGSFFYKDVTDLITGITVFNQTIPGNGAELFNVTTTVNAAKGYTYGAEIGTNQPFTFLPSPFDGLGLQANYTYVQSKTTVNGRTLPFPGSSKHNINLGVYYEKYGYSARVAYNYRTSYLSETGQNGIYTRGMSTVDVSLTKKIVPGLEVIFTGINLTGANQQLYSAIGGVFRSFYERPKTYSFGVRASF